jgi:dienelactone hydrolase
LACAFTAVYGNADGLRVELEPIGSGPHATASTNMRVAPQFEALGDELMHEVLLGRNKTAPRDVTEVLAYPEDAWLIDVAVPNQPQLYGPASGEVLPVLSYLVYPSKPVVDQNGYGFPYHGAQYGRFEHMLRPGESPALADPEARYPLIILSHGYSAHGIFDVGHAHRLASHGYIVAVIFYSDERTEDPENRGQHTAFLRPLLTKAVLDSILGSESFGPHIDTGSIGISGHSYGGFTILALAGGHVLGHAESVKDGRITAGVIAAPWVGSNNEGGMEFAFGKNNDSLTNVQIPIISFFGTADEVTTAASILPAMKRLSGPTYVVELVDQPHVFEGGSWQDRDNWELHFFNAHLKGDADSLRLLQLGESARGGNEDRQRFDYQRGVSR